MLSKSLFFLVASISNLVLLFLFCSNHFIVYFLVLFLVLYYLYKNYAFSYIIFLVYSSLVIVVMNLDIYDKYLFEFYLYTDLISKTTYLDSEIMYILTIVHLIFLINLKKFENFWDIMDKKLGIL